VSPFRAGSYRSDHAAQLMETEMTMRRHGDFRMINRIDVSTHEFEIAHGVLPRGYGHWAFFFGRSREPQDAWWCEGKYGDVKKLAIIEARRRRVFQIFVGS
jgi:hypothetical protein